MLETTFSNFSSPAILTTVNYSYYIELGQRLEKTIFVSETLKEFFKGFSNGPRNLNEFGKELPFASVDGSSLRLKQMEFHSHQRRVCSIHTFHESSGRAAEMIKITNSVIYTPLFSMAACNHNIASFER